MASLEKTIKSHKKLGNLAYAAQKWDVADYHWTQGLNLASGKGFINVESKLYSNRSATRLYLHKHEDALSDALKCIQINPYLEKGYIR